MKKYNINNSPQKSVLLYKKNSQICSSHLPSDLLPAMAPKINKMRRRRKHCHLMTFYGRSNIQHHSMSSQRSHKELPILYQCDLSVPSTLQDVSLPSAHGYVPEPQQSNSGDDHSSVRVCLLPSREHSCCQFKDFFWTSTDSFLRAVSRNT